MFGKRNPKIAWIILVAMLLAAIACSSGDTGDEAETDEATEVIEDQPKEEPKEEPKGEPKEDSQPEPESGGSGLTLGNVPALDILRSGTISETPLLATATSPDSGQFATFGFDKVVRIYDADSGDLLREMPGAGEYGFGLAYSPDGSVLASTAGFHVLLWNPNTGEKLRDVIVNSFAFRVVWAPDSSALAVVGDGSSKIEIIDPISGSIVDTLRNPSGQILWAVAYSPDGRLLATADGNGRLSVVEAETANIEFEDLQPSRGAAWDLEFSPDGSMLASCNAGGGVYIWDTSTWEVVLSGDDLFTGGCTDGDFNEDSNIYFGVGHDGWFYAWDTAEGALLTQLDFPKAIWSVSVAGNNQYLTLAVDDGSAYVLGIPE